jgi:hypothetical protein
VCDAEAFRAFAGNPTPDLIQTLLSDKAERRGPLGLFRWSIVNVELGGLRAHLKYTTGDNWKLVRTQPQELTKLRQTGESRL